MKIFDKVYFSTDFDFSIYQKEWENYFNNSHKDFENRKKISKFSIDFDFDGCKELGFDFSIRNPERKGETILSFNIQPNKAIELYHFLKKEIEELQTKQKLKDYLLMEDD